MTNTASGIQKEIKVKGQRLELVTNFKYLGAVVSDDVAAGGFLKDCTSHCSSDKAETDMEKNNISLGETDVFPCHSYISVCL